VVRLGVGSRRGAHCNAPQFQSGRPILENSETPQLKPMNRVCYVNLDWEAWIRRKQLCGYADQLEEE
jgi:hypothetical protein